MKNKYSLLAYLFACLCLAYAAMWFYPKWQKTKTEATISWDVTGYYLYLPSTFIYKDLKKVDFLEEVIEKYYPIPSSNQAVFDHPTGNRVMKYSMGQAVMYSPFFFAGHLYALNSSYPADGFSNPYQFSLYIGSLLVAFLGLWLIRGLLLKLFEDKVVAASLVLLVISTNYLEYAGLTNCMTHNYLFTLYALLILSTQRFFQKPSYFLALIIGLLIGLAALTRPTEIIISIIPLFWLEKKMRLSFMKLHWKKYLLAGLATLFVGFWQLIYWKYVGDEWIIYSYQDQGFDWLSPEFANGIFSYRAGWLIYTPIMILAIFGFIPLYKKRVEGYSAMLILFLTTLYVAFSWDIWWYGGSLGQRVMVQSYSILLFPFCASLEWLSTKRWPLKTGLLLFISLCIYFNIWLHYQAHRGKMYRAGNMTKAYFLRVVGTWEFNPLDIKLLDTKEDYQGKRLHVQTIYKNNFEENALENNSPYQVIAGQHSIWVDADKEHSETYSIPILDYPKSSWLRVQAQFYCPTKVPDYWFMPYMNVSLTKTGEKEKEQFIRPFRFIGKGQTKEVYMDISLPDKNKIDQVDVAFWRGNGMYPMVIDNLEIELYQEP